MTAQPHAQVRFRRAIERRALWLAEDAARELPNLSLQEMSERSSSWANSAAIPSGHLEGLPRKGISLLLLNR